MQTWRDYSDWVAIILLSLAPIVAAVIRKLYNDARLSNDSAGLASFIIGGIILFGFMFMLARHDKITTKLDSLFVSGHTESENVWVEQDEKVEAHYEIVEAFFMNNPKDQWKIDIIDIYFFVMLIGSPILTWKLIGNLNEEKPKQYSRI